MANHHVRNGPEKGERRVAAAVRDMDDGSETASNNVPLTKLKSGSVMEKRKPFLRVYEETDIPTVAKDLVAGDQPWISGVPDVLLTFITGNLHFDQWKRDDFRSAFQGAVLKIVSSLSVAIFDDGLHYGASKLLGAAIREEEMYRGGGKEGKTKSVAPLIGAVPVSRLDDRDLPAGMDGDDLAHSVESGETVELDNVPKLGLNPHHSGYVYFTQASYRSAGLMRVALEKRVQDELSIRAGGNGAQRRVPLVAVLFQGEIDDLERVKAYLTNGVPVIVMDGCGGLGDVIGSAVTDSSEMDGNRLRGNVESKLQRSFPHLRQNENVLADSTGSVLEALGLSYLEAGNGAPLLSVMNCRQVESFENLNSQILQCAITSSTANASPESFATYLNLAVKANKIYVAKNFLLGKRPWSNMELPSSAFELALLLPGREAFIDTFLMQKFPVRNYLSHLKLLKLFREAKDRQFFPVHVWEGMLRYSITQPIGEAFLLQDLNRLIYKLTGVHNYIDPFELSANAYGRKGSPSPYIAERKAMNAVTVFAVLFNRPKLAKICIKYAKESVLQALFAESLFHAMYKCVPNIAVSAMLKATADDFAGVATELLDSGVSASPVRGHAVLTRHFTDFGNKTPLEMAYDSNNKKFIAHNNVQSWLDQYYYNFIKVKGNHDNLKMFASALLIFPMYLWLTFPRLRKPSPPHADDAKDMIMRPRNEQDVQRILNKVKKIQGGEASADRSIRAVERPSLGEMVKAVWAAPVVKFYMWHLFYWMFIILICTDMMMPGCRYIGVDIAVWVFTITMWLEIVARTIYDVQNHRRFDRTERAYDLISQTVFNILFFLYRICPYRYDHPFAGRVILGFGILYYAYRVWGLFYYMERTIGPLIRVTIQMFTLDLSRWILLVAPMLIGSTVIWMGVINPDWPMSGDDWRHAFYRGVITLFGAFYIELDYYGPNVRCQAKNNIANVRGPDWTHYKKFPNGTNTEIRDAHPPERCWTGDYDDYTCPTVSIWSYFFVIQFYVYLKLGLANMLTAFYVTRNMAQGQKAAMVWRYHRTRIILDYANRTPLPPPFFSLGYLFLIIKSCGSKWTGDDPSHGLDVVDSDADTDAMESNNYWSGVTLEYFRKKEMQEAAAGAAQQQLNQLTAIQQNVGLLTKKITSADRKIVDVEEATKQSQIKVYDTQAAVKQNKSITLTDFAHQWPHNLSRTTPYPGTTVQRLFVEDDKVPWTAQLDNYKPPSYNKASLEFSGSERNFVDPEADYRSDVVSRAGSTAGSVYNLPGYQWNAVDNAGDSAVLRRSWITTDDKQLITYDVDKTGAPLNPFGRTGLRGRGALHRFGPNHKVMMVITARVPDGFRYIVQKTIGKVPRLPQSFVNQYESEYAVGCLLMDAFLFDTSSLAVKDLNVSNVRTMQSMYNIVESVLKSRLSAIIDNFEKRQIVLREIFRGYVDNPQNTDNAWTEAVVFHINLPPFGIDKFKNYRWREYSTEIALSEFDTAAIRQIAVEYGL